MSTSDQTLPFITREQFASLFGVSEATVFRWVAEGKAPPSYKVGGQRLWKMDDVHRWLERECRQEAEAAS